MGVGTEILFMITLGLVVLGPKRLYGMLGHVERAKAELQNATRGIKSQFDAELNVSHGNGTTDCSRDSEEV